MFGGQLIIAVLLAHLSCYAEVRILCHISKRLMMLGNVCVCDVLQERTHSKAQLEHRLDNVTEFIKLHGLPDDLRERIFNPINILSFVPKLHALGDKVPIRFYQECLVPLRDMLHCHPLFDGGEAMLVHVATMHLEELHLIPGDAVYQVGSVAEAMYVLFSGIVVIFGSIAEKSDGEAQKGMPEKRLGQGAFFGEDGLLFDMVWSDTAMADDSGAGTCSCS